MKEAHALLRMLRISPYKLNDVVKLIRGKKAQEALQILKGTRKRIASDVAKAVRSAMANAENNLGIDKDRLVVVEASVGKNMVLRRIFFGARSRSGRVTKPFSQVRIRLASIA